MKSMDLVTFIAALWSGAAAAQAQFVCPPMPAAATTISRDFKPSITASMGKLAGLKAAELSVQAEVVAKSVFQDFPGVDRLATLQTMSATYCEMLRADAINPHERLDRWERFQTSVLNASR